MKQERLPKWQVLFLEPSGVSFWGLASLITRKFFKCGRGLLDWRPLALNEMFVSHPWHRTVAFQKPGIT